MCMQRVFIRTACLLFSSYTSYATAEGGRRRSETWILSHGMTDARRLHGQILERQVDRWEVVCIEATQRLLKADENW